MSAGSSQQQAPAAWTEPPWSGWIETTGDALLILEAARRGLIPRVTRRLVDAERKMITSGSVFVFDEDESGIKRWTDGLFWSPSRILGNFLLYRETDKRGHRTARADPDDTPELKPDGTLSRPKTEITTIGIDKHRERTLLGSLTNSYKFKPDGLMKKTFSLTIGGVAQHLISYYKIEDVENGRLRTPSSLPELAVLEISAEYLDKTHFRNPPKVEIGANGSVRYTGEGDEMDTPSSASSTATRQSMASNLPLLTDGQVEASPSSKRPQKRFLPYAHRSSKKKSKSQPETPEGSTSVTPALTPEASTGSIVLTSPQPSTSAHAISAPPTPLYQPDSNPSQPTSSSYPQQYGYFPPPSHPPPPPAMAYPPHPSGAIYSQPNYPPPAPQPAMGPMNPQQSMPQYGYPGYQPMHPPNQASHGQHPQDPSRTSPSMPQSHPGQAPPPPQPYYSYYPHAPQPPPPPPHSSYSYPPAPTPGAWPPYPSTYAPPQQHQTHTPTQIPRSVPPSEGVTSNEPPANAEQRQS